MLKNVINVATLMLCAISLCHAVDPVCEGAAGPYVRDPSACNKYFICIDGVASPQDCFPGLNFDSATGECSVDAVCCPPGEIKRVPVKASADCTQFHLCVDGVIIPSNKTSDNFYSCAAGTKFDSDYGNCNTGLTCTPGSTNQCSDGTVIMYEGNACDIYYVCVEGEPVQQKCPPGYEFKMQTSTPTVGNCVLATTGICCTTGSCT